jgi:hypothetical protein
MTPRRRRQGGNSRKGRGWWGIGILAVAGLGVWMGSQLVDGEGDLLPARTLPAEAPEGAGEGAFPSAPGGAGGAADGGALQRPIPEVGNRIRVEVLNASGIRGVAAQARDALRDEGFDVVHYGNWSRSDLEDSEVLLRAGDAAAAHGVARALGIRTVREAPDSTLFVDVTVLLGARWTTVEWIQRRETR